MSAPSLNATAQRLAVAVELPQHAGTGATLDYTSEEPLSPGSLVRVPLGRRDVPGIVWDGGLARAAEAQALKPVRQALTALPPLPEAWRQLVAFAAGYYQRGLGELALAVLPPELRKLDATQLARRLKRPSLPAPQGGPEATADAPPLTPEQAAAAAAVAATPVGTLLLHGVTGSGKTEVYMEAAARVLEQGRQVLVLVPEINLTPQLEARFASRFAQHRLASQHSGLTPAQRLKHWLAAHLGQADLVLGTRLAVFASMPRLGLIVVDEEHDPSFKQQEGARYSARDLAVYRGKLENVPVLLGSATPSLESWHRAQQGHYKLLSMPTRIGHGVLPALKVVDMSRQPRANTGPGDALCAPLLQALRERLARGEQSLLLLNRRGYAPVLHCSACGWKSACRHCSAWRVFHKADRTLRCHHCGFSERVPRACPDCGNLDIAAAGRGTERLEEQLAELLPGARIGRIDADSTRLKGSLQAQLAAVHGGEIDILVGTQMVAKGHDFRRVTLVAAVSPDNALYSSDFRAPERLFALLMQAAGRAGRDAALGAGSQMWVQTWNPRHPIFAALAKHDYAAFAASQLKDREGAGLPPFAHLALLRAESKDAAVAMAFLRDAAQAAAALPQSAGLMVYPPVPPAVARVADVERVQMLVESPSRTALQKMLSAWQPALLQLRSAHKGLARWAIDVDPLAI
jgi:primosomal protein N' (replication factor Y) (superfamily II helicase)